MQTYKGSVDSDLKFLFHAFVQQVIGLNEWIRKMCAMHERASTMQTEADESNKSESTIDFKF